MINSFYNRRVFLETAVPTMMGIMLKPRYHIINFIGLWKERRKTAMEYLKKAETQITIHPIKFSNLTYQEEVNKYIFFMNGLDY